MDKKKIYFDIYLLERLEDGTVNVYQKNLAGRAYFQAYNDRLDPILKEIAELKKIAWKKDTFSDNMAYSLMHQCG